MDHSRNGPPNQCSLQLFRQDVLQGACTHDATNLKELLCPVQQQLYSLLNLPIL